MALQPDDAAREELTPREIHHRCTRLTDHIRRITERALKAPSYGTWAHVYRLKAERKRLQALIRPRLATVDGEAVEE